MMLLLYTVQMLERLRLLSQYKISYRKRKSDRCKTVIKMNPEYADTTEIRNVDT